MTPPTALGDPARRSPAYLRRLCATVRSGCRSRIDWTPSRGVADARIGQAWQARLDDARQYQAAHGHLHPPAGTKVNGKRLDAWLSVQRARNREGRLTPQQIAALERRWSRAGV